MARRKRTSAERFRVGKVTVYLHHGAWWLYYSEGGERVRRKVSEFRNEAEKVAAQVNSQVAQGARRSCPSTRSACPSCAGSSWTTTNTS
jgi:hypothetical protein